MKGIAIVSGHKPELSVAEPHRVFEHGLKYGLEIAGRAIDHAQHFRRRRLLLQRCFQFAPEPRDLCLLAGGWGFGGTLDL